MSVQLYRDGKYFAIKTDCHNEDAFRNEFSWALSNLIDNNAKDEDSRFYGDWQYSLEPWLEKFTELCCQYRGYKTNEVKVTSIYLSGDMCTPTDLVCVFDSEEFSRQQAERNKEDNERREQKREEEGELISPSISDSMGPPA